MIVFAFVPMWQSSVGDPDFFNGYLILGYVVMGLIGLSYIVSLAIRPQNLQRDIRLMQQILQDDENEGDS